MIYYYNGNVTLSNYQDAVELTYINEDYLSVVMETRENIDVNERNDDGGYAIDPPIEGASDFFSKYWIDLPFYENVQKMGLALGLTEEHIQNLIVPLSDMERVGSITPLPNRKEISKEFDALIDLIDSLRDSKDKVGLEIESISVVTGYNHGRELGTGRRNIKKIKPASTFNQEVTLKMLQKLLLQWSETPSFKSNIQESNYRGRSKYSYKLQKKSNEAIMMLIVYQYIVKHDLSVSETVINPLDSGHTNASRMTGYLVETAKLTRLLDRLLHIEETQKKWADFETSPDVISGEKTNPIDVLAELEQLNLNSQLKHHALGKNIKHLGARKILDDLPWLMREVHKTISVLSEECLDKYLAQRLADRYSHLINDHFNRLEKL